MADHSFEIKTCADMLIKLKEEYSDFEKQPLSSRHAINSAMTSWHLVDWTIIEFENKHGFKIYKRSQRKPNDGLLGMEEYRAWL